VASGPQPLIEMYDYINKMLSERIGKTITSSDIVDIFNLVGKCVVSGNVRRSAEIMFGNPEDDDFIELKNPEKFKEQLYNHRWASNNSIFATIGMDYTKFAEHTAKNGEPGYEWLENAQNFSRMDGVIDMKDYRAKGGNPCLEQTLEPYELCCLVETYPSKHETVEEWHETLKYAYMYAKTVTLIPTHNELTNSVMLRNRRIGCSMSGIVQAFKKFGRRKFLQSSSEGYDKIQQWDKVYSDWLCIPRSIKTTSVKPSGTVSLLVGVTPGIHYPLSEYYIRNVRFQEGSPMLEKLKEAGYAMEKDKYSPNTIVVSFPVKEEYFDRSAQDVCMWEQLENAAQIQEYWADNQVSVTITFTKEEAKDIGKALELYETRLKGVSFLPKSDHGYEQAPYIPITKEKYEEMIDNLSRIKKIKGDTHEITEKGCDGESCSVI
jgi:ribonucleoside-triphosphate reductase (thioredoxin)